jgi:putative MATE family efflux protein
METQKSLNQPAKGPAFRRDWTQGSLLGNLWFLAWPMLITNTINSIGPTVDMIWVGKLGANSIAGVGVSGVAVMVVNSLLFGVFTGTTAIVARLIGARDEKTANRAAQQAFVVALALSILVALIGIFLAEPIMRMLGVSEGVVSEGAAYLRIQLIGIVTMSGLQVAQSIMQASGDSRNPLKISIGFRLLQVALCPALIFGWGIFPDMGVKGAALSNVISQGLGGIVALWILFSGRTRVTVTFKNFHFDPGLIWRTVKIGIPSSTTFVLISVTELIMVKFLTPFGTVAVAAESVALRIDQIVQNLSGGFGNAAGVLGGQNLGAGKPECAARTAWLAVGLASIISVTCSIVIWLRIEPVLHLFSSDPAVISTTANFLKIQTVSYMVWGLVVALSLILNGMGDTMIPMLTNIITMLGIQCTLAYILPQSTSLGMYGVRWAIVAGLVARAVIYPTYFSTGRWKHKKV